MPLFPAGHWARSVAGGGGGGRGWWRRVATVAGGGRERWPAGVLMLLLLTTTTTTTAARRRARGHVRAHLVQRLPLLRAALVHHDLRGLELHREHPEQGGHLRQVRPRHLEPELLVRVAEPLPVQLRHHLPHL